MADERNRWLDRAAAERLLHGEPPVGPEADQRTRADAARLRAALGALTPTAPTGRELPGEAAAVAAFRAAHGTDRATAAAGAATAVTTAAAAALAEPLVDLAPLASVRIPVQRRRVTPVRLGLAAALASVAVGGLAVASTGLLDRGTHDSAGPGPAVSLSLDAQPSRDGGGTGPTLSPQLRPNPLRSGEGPQASAGASLAPGADGRSGFGSGTGAGTGTGPGPTGSAGNGTAGGRDSFTDTGTAAGNGSTATDKDGESRLKAVDLCEDYRMGRLTKDRTERLRLIAKGAAKIAHYCEDLLDGPGGVPRSGTAGTSETTGGRVGSPTGGVVAPLPTLGTGSALGFRTQG